MLFTLPVFNAMADHCICIYGISHYFDMGDFLFLDALTCQFIFVSGTLNSHIHIFAHIYCFYS